MEMVLGPLVGDGILIYLDDILGYASTLEELHEIQRKVFERLRKEGLYCKRNKCEFDLTQVEYVGYIVDQHGGHTDKKKCRQYKTGLALI